MPRPNVADWKKYDELLDAGTKGWNPLARLPELLNREFAWTKEFTFGFFSEDDLTIAGSKGWVHVRPEHFDIDSWNNVVGLRFALVDNGGVLKFRDNYLMMMPKDYRKRQIAVQNQAHEDAIAESARNAGYAHPDDPEYGKMMRAAQDLSSGEVYQVRADGEPERDEEAEQRPRRGRPRKGE